MDSRSTFLRRVGMRWDDGRYNVGLVIGFMSWAVDRQVGKSACTTSRQTKPPQGGIRQKSSPRKISKHNFNAHVPKTDTGGLV